MPSYTCRILVLSVCKMNVFLNFMGNVLVVGEGAGHFTGDERSLGREPSQELSVQVSSGCPLHKLSMTKETSGECPLHLWLNQEAAPWINPAQIPLMERSHSLLESQQRLAGEQI